MSKKKRTKRSGHPGRSPHLALVGKPSTADTALQLRFHAWYRQHVVGYDDHPDAEQVRQLTTVLFEFAASHGLSLGQPRLPVLAQFLDLLDDDNNLGQLATPALNILDHYLEFLGETGSWSGTEDEYVESRDLVLTLLEGETEPDTIVPELLAGIEDLPVVALADQLNALEAMTPIAAVTALFDWIGPGRPVTSTGALRLADIEPVAAMLGLRTVGERGAPQPMLSIFPDEDEDADASDDAVIRVGSMWDLIELSRWWSALEEVGLIEITPTRLRKGPRTAKWRSSAATGALGIRTEFLSVYLEEWFGPAPSAFLPSLAPYALLHNLAQLSAAVNPAVHPELSSDAIRDEVRAAAPPSPDGLDLERVAALTTENSIRHLREMRMLSAQPAADGQDRYIVAEAARPAFADGVRSLRQIFVSIVGPGLGSEQMHPPGTVLRLKIALVDSKPAVWRRVTVSADASLADLHSIIQLVFGWTNSHLHQFVEGDWYRPEAVITDAGFQEFFDEDIEDESEILIGEIFDDPGAELRYVYDFGDNWRHIIRLEGIEPSGTAAPHCIDGRGLAPIDDAGGVYGWAEKVRISQDPKDPDHEDIRDWLGLTPGEQLDPKRFDVAEADAALATMRWPER